MNRLLSAVVHITPDQPMPRLLGRAAQAWLLDQVRQADPSFAEALHSGQTRRPYTISAPRGTPEARWLRITSVSADLTALLVEKVLPQIEQQPIRLAEVRVKVTGVDIENHAWAGQSDFETLAYCAFDRETSQFRMEFATPTAFHRAGLTIPLPLPPLVYASLIQGWNAFSPLPLPVKLMDFVESHIGIARHRIVTQMAQFGERERHVGFTGTTQFVVAPQARTTLSADAYRQIIQTLDLLTEFAFYAGVGVRTAVGMGQVRPISKSQVIIAPD
jgi:CRISPR-associated endoribonuclease Cas6